MPPEISGTVVSCCHHGASFAAAVEKGNVFGTQFHPEADSASALDLRIFEEFICGMTGESIELRIAA